MVLVVECGKCGTRFQLDSSRIPDAGIRVRCSRCKHAFFLNNPSQSQANAIDAVAQEAIEQESVPTPAATHDLAGHISPGEGAGASNVVAGPDDEEDWEFNEDPIPDEDSGEYDDIDVDEDIDFDLESDAEGFSAEAFDQDAHDSDRIELADTGAETVMNESSASCLDGGEIGVDDLAQSNMSVESVEVEGIDEIPEDSADDEQADGPAPGFGGEREAGAFGSMEDFAGERTNDAEEQPVATALSGEQENIEDPESWDFFGDDAAPSQAPVVSESSAFSAAAEAPLQDVNPAAIGVDADSEWRAYERQGPVGAASRIAGAVMTVAVFGLLIAGVYLGVIGSLDSGIRTPAFVDIGQMRAANIRGQWLDTESVGTVYVVSGDLLNPGTTIASPDRAVRVTLLDADGTALEVGPSFAGTGLEFDTLRQVARDDVLSAQLNAARALASQEIAPGHSVPIAAAFVDLPADATHFALNALDLGALDQWVTEVGGGTPTGADVAATEVTPSEAVADEIVAE